MKFLITTTACARPETGVLPRKELAEAMLDFGEALATAGVPVEAEGLCAGSGAPSTCAGFLIIDISSEKEAIGWALRLPRVAGGEAIGIRQIHGATEILEEMRSRELAGRDAVT